MLRTKKARKNLRGSVGDEFLRGNEDDAKLKLRQCTFSTRSRFEIKKNNSSIIFIMLLGSGRQANSSIILIMLLESGRQAGRAAGIR